MEKIIYHLVPVTEVNKGFVNGEYKSISISTNICGKYIAVKAHAESGCTGCPKHPFKLEPPQPPKDPNIIQFTYEFVPVTWLNEPLIKDKEIFEFPIDSKPTPKKQKFVMVLKHEDRQCPGIRCPKHPLKTQLFAKMDEMNGWRWGDYLTR
jgi:hypothetical protein